MVHSNPQQRNLNHLPLLQPINERLHLQELSTGMRNLLLCQAEQLLMVRRRGGI